MEFLSFGNVAVVNVFKCKIEFNEGARFCVFYTQTQHLKITHRKQERASSRTSENHPRAIFKNYP